METPLHVADCLDLEKNIFEEFRVSYQKTDYNIDAPQPSLTKTYLGKPNTPLGYSPIQKFSKSVKKNIRTFIKLKDSKQWDSCYLATKA